MVYCTKGHFNSSDSRFCSLCGERLLLQQSFQGVVLGERYRIQQELGQGGFGRTYLAEDLNRYRECCVLKEFAPQVQGSYALQKAEELFGREAGVLYKLQHPQIPRFRELFRAELEAKEHLFLVQDYVEGQTYRQLLTTYRTQGQCFSETEVVQLLTQLLPVLTYIHSVGVIHRDISPDNLILRNHDRLPVLIDFGGVKQVETAIASEVMQPFSISEPAATRLGKVGYAPPEQMQTGRVYPHSDLYALAMTILVLLTGQEPQELLDHPTVRWQQRVNISPTLLAILERMLAHYPGDRFQSAVEVLQALQPNPKAVYSTPVSLPPPTYPSTQATVATPIALPAKRSSRRNGWIFPVLLLGIVGVGLWTHRQWFPLVKSLLDRPATETGIDPSSQFSPEEQARKANLRDRRAALGVDADFLVNITDNTFYQRYPDQQGRTLTDQPEDADWRTKWDAIASEWLTFFENNLSTQARANLGSYDSSDRQQWKQTVNQLYVSSRALNDLTDAKFLRWFPDQQGQDFLNTAIGQVWYAIALDEVNALQSKTILTELKFDRDTFSQQVRGTLNPRAGQVYIANLSEGQLMRLKLQAPSRSTHLSLYLPRPTAQLPVLLEDSNETTWSGGLPQSGFYEIVIVSTADEAIDFQLNIAVDNVTSTPLEPSEPEAPEAKN